MLYLRFTTLNGADTLTLDTVPLGSLVYDSPRLSHGEVVTRWDGAAIITAREVPSAYRDVGRVLTVSSTQSGNLIEGAVDTATRQAFEAFMETNLAGFKVQSNLIDPPLDHAFRLLPGTFVTFTPVTPARDWWAWTLTAVRITV